MKEKRKYNPWQENGISEIRPNIKVKVLLLESGLTQADMVEKTGLPRTVLNQILSGRIIPKAREEQVIASALNKDVTELFPA